MEDDKLLEKYKKTKDQEVYSELFRRYMPLIYGLCLKYYKVPEDAEDAVMDLYEKLSQKTLSHEIQNFKSWLYTVCRNHCLEQFRKRNSKNLSNQQLEIMYSDESFHPDTVHKDQEVNLLHDCIQSLDSQQRACIDLFYFKKLSYLEISDQLSLDFNQVRSRIQNGRRNIKICIESNKSNVEY